MKHIARRKFLSSAIKVGALLPVFNAPVTLLAGQAHENILDADLPGEYIPTALPDRIILTVTEKPATSITINWRTSDTTKDSMVEYLPADAHPKFTSAVNQLKALSRAFNFEKISAINHRVSINDLKPATQYMYRVGNTDNWSEWMQFRTADNTLKKPKLSFIYFGDAQQGIKPLWSRVIRKAYAAMPDAQLILHAGDLVNVANKDQDWGEWFAAGEFIHGTIPSVMTPGNHEYTHEDGKSHLSVYWKQQFLLPQNGPADELLENSSYYTDIQGVRIISLNTQMIEEAPAEACITRQREWLEALLKSNPQKWTCVVMHHPVYSTKKGRDNKKTRTHLKPLFDKYGVDLVLQGHDHAYARGMHKIALTGGGPGDRSGTMYVVSVSGSKMYETEPQSWADTISSHLQIYHLIDIDDQVLSFKAYLATGELLDAFDLIKQKGKPNKLANRHGSL
ncbi:MAG TPA: metallophosphoesterase family protein [Pedobacter sp.]|uniref:metallophosphoesterase family protein n=1 Tax=Pedobacter sp. TaxID=1411316 RepID=UPI002CFF18DE|nr:metallophosphoesterase family protein [Pedobacter sp.]HMI05404.1 metallophosphoesterase family protein [Pedobacter sp.]